MARVILASRSARRKQLLSLIVKKFSISPSGFNEEEVEEKDPFMLVRMLSLGKACAVEADPEDIVLGCDTVVYVKGEILGIPADREEARRMLNLLSGDTHSVITGVCLRHQGQLTHLECETKVTFRTLTPAQIEAYLDTDEPFDKAGAYGIQEKGSLFVEGIEGDFFNVMGLPVVSVARLLAPLLEDPLLGE